MDQADIPYSMNFKDLSRLVEDLGYLAQKNGLFNVFQAGGKMSKADKKLLLEKILKYVKLIFGLFFLIMFLYVVYYTLFKGYLRSFVNVGTWSFKHKAKLDETLQERNVLVNHLQFLMTEDYTTTCHNPHKLYDMLNGTNSSIHNLCVDYNRLKDNAYQEYVNEERYFYSLKDYFMFSSHFEVVNGVARPLPSYKPYLRATLRISGELDMHESNSAKRSYDRQMAILDSDPKYVKMQSKHALIVGSIDKIAKEVGAIQSILSKNVIIPYIVIPRNNGEIQAIKDDFAKYGGLLAKGGGYDTIEFSSMSDISWYLVEYMANVIHVKKEGGSYETIYKKYTQSGDLTSIRLPEEKNKRAMAYFMGLSRQDRQAALDRFLFGGNTLKSKMDTLQKDIEDLKTSVVDVNRDIKILELGNGGDRLPQLRARKIELENTISKKSQDLLVMQNQNSEKTRFLEFIQKRPIFTYIYFSGTIPEKDKAGLYGSVMKAYTLFCDCTLHVNSIRITEDQRTRILNLQSNGSNYKQFVNVIGYLHMFLNVYKKEIALGYKKQNITEKEFFMEMWTPFKNDFVDNRLVPTAKSTFALASHFKQFMLQWEVLGKHIKEKTTAIYKAFFTSTPIEKPRSESLT